MLRHGLSVNNERRVFSGATDVPLSDGGREALRAMRDQCPQVEVFFTSGMLRARETLQILYGDVPSTTIPALAEYRFGDFEGRGHDELFEKEPVYRLWLSEDVEDVTCPGGETRGEFAERILRGWATLAAQDWQGLAVLVSHGGVIAQLMRRLARFDGNVGDIRNGCGFRVWIAPDATIPLYEAFP